ncbi:hypothetical protein LEMLEM_LOCUS4093, partial [Lemmus lemmus]
MSLRLLRIRGLTNDTDGHGSSQAQADQSSPFQVLSGFSRCLRNQTM